MKAKRRQELKQDEFVDTLVWLWETVKKNQQQIVVGVLVAVALVAAVTLIVPQLRQRRYAAWASLSAIEQSVVAPPEGAQTKPGELEAAQVEKYRKLAADYSGSGAAPIALYQAAQLLHETGKLDEALKALNELLASYPKCELAVAAEAAKATVLEDQGKYAEAKALYEKVAQSGPRYLSPECYLNAARCAELMKDVVQAKELYRKAEELGKGTGWEQLAKERIARLERPAPVTSPPPTGEKKG